MFFSSKIGAFTRLPHQEKEHVINMLRLDQGSIVSSCFSAHGAGRSTTARAVAGFGTYSCRPSACCDHYGHLGLRETLGGTKITAFGKKLGSASSRICSQGPLSFITVSQWFC